jgi:two-component system, LytTR family, response regulator
MDVRAMTELMRAVIVDDEQPARDRIRGLLALEPDIELSGEFGDPLAAARALEDDPPDILFLDIQMPRLDGIRLLRDMQQVSEMHVVFVTAFEQHALTAFELDAADYLLKPFDPDRFSAAVERVRTRVRLSRTAAQQVAAGAPSQQKTLPGTGLEHIAVRAGDEIVLLRPAEIDWIEALGNYIRLHAGNASFLLRVTMRDIEERLDQSKFVRIHRSTIVNVDRIRRLRPLHHGEYEIVLSDGRTLTMSRGFKEKLRERWGSWL